VSGLGVSDFRVLDNGREQTIATFEKIGSRAAPARRNWPAQHLLEPGRRSRIGPVGQGETAPGALDDSSGRRSTPKYRNQTVVRRAGGKHPGADRAGGARGHLCFGLALPGNSQFLFRQGIASCQAQGLSCEVPAGTICWTTLTWTRTATRHHRRRNSRRATMPAGSSTRSKRSEAIANHVKSVPGRKNLLWLSAAFPLTTGTAQRTVAPGIGYDGPLDQWRTFGMEMNRTMAALNDAGRFGLSHRCPRPHRGRLRDGRRNTEEAP